MSAYDSEARRLNPIVDRYVTTDLPLLDIARLAPTRQHPLVKALVLTQECLTGSRLARDAISASEAVPLKGSDPELMTLLLASWAELCIRIGRPSDSEALLHRARGLINEASHPAIRAYVLFADALLVNSRGNRAQCETILREILALVPEPSPRRKFYVWELALFLAQQGRGDECKEEIRSLTWQCNERFQVTRILMVQFVNAVETGNVQDASMLQPQIATAAQPLRTLTRIPLGGYQALLKMMHDAVEGRGHPLPVGGSTAGKRPEWVEIAHLLLNRDPTRALALAKEQTKHNLDYLLGSAFDAFGLIRAELSAQHGAAARHLIKLRHSRDNTHYLDDFFLARVERLEGNQTLAAQCFGRALAAIDQREARGRLDFELTLSCEMSQGDIVALTQTAGRQAAKKQARVAKKAASRPDEGAEAQGSRRGDQQQRELAVIIGRSDSTKQMRETIRRFADLDAPVLITGETGTGKEVVARALHAASKRHNAPFVAVNCSAITETLLESELFGYERGAFTGAERTTEGLFESAGTGVIFLDEIGDISPRLQMSLLRVLETGEIRGVGSNRPTTTTCRVIAATNAELSQRTEDGAFRRDLLFRLQRLLLHIPPLRERRDDIPPLVRHFLDQGRKIGTHAKLSADIAKAFRHYDWPGNVRELKNVIERMRMMHSDRLTYAIEDLDLKLQPPPAPQPVTTERAQNSSSPLPPSSPPVLQSSSPPPASIDSLLRGGRSPLRRLDRLRELFTTYGKLTRREIIQVSGVSPNTATKDLKMLCEEGFIERIEPSASTRSHYFQVTPTTNPS